MAQPHRPSVTASTLWQEQHQQHAVGSCHCKVAVCKCRAMPQPDSAQGRLSQRLTAQHSNSLQQHQFSQHTSAQHAWPEKVCFSRCQRSHVDSSTAAPQPLGGGASLGGQQSGQHPSVSDIICSGQSSLKLWTWAEQVRQGEESCGPACMVHCRYHSSTCKCMCMFVLHSHVLRCSESSFTSADDGVAVGSDKIRDLS